MRLWRGGPKGKRGRFPSMASGPPDWPRLASDARRGRRRGAGGSNQPTVCRRKRIEVPLKFLAKGVNPRIPLRVLYLRGTISLALRMGVVGPKRIDRCLRDQYLSRDFTCAVMAAGTRRWYAPNLEESCPLPLFRACSTAPPPSRPVFRIRQLNRVPSRFGREPVLMLSGVRQENSTLGKEDVQSRADTLARLSHRLSAAGSIRGECTRETTN